MTYFITFYTEKNRKIHQLRVENEDDVTFIIKNISVKRCRFYSVIQIEYHTMKKCTVYDYLTKKTHQLDVSKVVPWRETYRHGARLENDQYIAY